MSDASLREKIVNAIDSYHTQISDLSQKLYERPEVAYQEFFAVDLLTHILETSGFKISRNVGGLPTAFIGSIRSAIPGPTIALIAEYDALPNIGHGCGHNLIAAGAVGAAIGISKNISDIQGEVRIIGTPAEEYTDGKAGKILLIENGIFNDVEACFMFHPWIETTIAKHDFGFISQEITFSGKPAHAAADPWNGQNALDAAVLTYNSISLLRQQLKPDCRVHCIITNGGEVLNVIPNRTCMKLMFRSSDSEYLLDLKDKLEKCVTSAADATNTTAEIRQLTHILPIKFNKTLSEIVISKANLLGEDVNTTELLFASSDFGNLSHHCPSLNIMFKTHESGVNWHSKRVADDSIEPYAVNRTVLAAKLLALSAVDILLDSSKLSA